MLGFQRSADLAPVAAVKMGAKGTDVAARILAENEGVDDTWTAEDDKRLVRKMDWTLIPIVRPFLSSVALADCRGPSSSSVACGLASTKVSRCGRAFQCV